MPRLHRGLMKVELENVFNLSVGAMLSWVCVANPLSVNGLIHKKTGGHEGVLRRECVVISEFKNSLWEGMKEDDPMNSVSGMASSHFDLRLLAQTWAGVRLQRNFKGGCQGFTGCWQKWS